MASKDKSGAKGGQAEKAIHPLRANLFDPMNAMRQIMGTRQLPSQAIGMATLRTMAARCQPVSAVIRTRQNQVANFARRPHFQGDLGVVVRLKDIDEAPTKLQKKRMRELEGIILACGVGPAEGRIKRPGFDPWLRMIVRDSLSLDAIASEMRYDRKGDLFDWWATDAGTIRLTANTYTNGHMVQGSNMWGAFGGGTDGNMGEGYGGVPLDADEPAAFVQMISGQIFSEFGADDIAYWVRNPRTDVDSNGYGYSEMEDLIDTITGYLNGMTYNSRYFTHGNIPEGVLGLQGNYNAEQLQDFIRYWNAMVSGVGNSWRVPVMAFRDGKGLQWTPIKQSNKDMEFHSWLDFLITVVCAIYQCDREEIGFGGKQAGTPGGGLGEGSNEATLIHSQSKGLRPLLQRIQSGINDDIMPKLADSEDFEAAFTGLDPDIEDKKIDRATKFLQAGLKTPNEGRAEFDIPPVAPEKLWGDVPKDPTLFQAWQMGKQAELQAQGMGGEDQGGGGDDQAPPPGGAPQSMPAPGAPQTLPKVNEDGSEDDGPGGAGSPGGPGGPPPGK